MSANIGTAINENIVAIYDLILGLVDSYLSDKNPEIKLELNPPTSITMAFKALNKVF